MSPGPTQARWPALGMTVVVELAVPGALERARRILADELAAADEAYSPVRADTELAGVQAAGGTPVAVSGRLLDAVGVALWAARVTGGLVDPTAGSRLALLEDAAGRLDEPRRLRARRVGDWRAVVCDVAAATVQVPAGVRLDLGATGKALIADRAAARIAALGPGALVSVGGDLATAGEPPPGGWLVRVTDDHRATAGGQLVRLASGALATSSTTVRRDRRGAVHIVDPRGGRAGGTWRTASVTAATCVEANAASTAALVLGDAAPDWLERLALPARLVARDGAALSVAGWPQDAAA